MKKFSVTLVKSKIGCSDDMIRTVEALGLKRRAQTVEVLDNPANRGQLMKVQHLIEVKVIKG